MAHEQSQKKRHFNRLAKGDTSPPVNVSKFPQSMPGLLVTKDLDEAIVSCKAQVARIAKDCKARNRKFRDIEFDLENDKGRCLAGIRPADNERFDPADVHRVTQIFENPQFFSHDTANASDIKQGALGDCWFLSALATTSTARGLIEKICVARDAQVGVYGFIFFRDETWVTVIIDDLLYTTIPKWEELRPEEQALYHQNKDTYNRSARKGGESLYFAKSGTKGETWVPLIEKAYAKLYGNFGYISGGRCCEGIEDLTGGVSTTIKTKDILDIDRFWHEELTFANKDRLFGCSFDGINTARTGAVSANVQGLFGNHAYSVLRAVEVNGKRFVVIRNPWGEGEWTGRWSDGSKEWTYEWLKHLPALEHSFGDDGQFVMEYSDWLECFSDIDRCRLFDDQWVMSSQWLAVTCPPLPSAWSYGDVCFQFSLSAPTTAVIVLSRLNSRYFRDLEGAVLWTFDFTLVKDGNTEPIADSARSKFWQRSVHLEATLSAGDYTVYVRLDRSPRERPDNSNDIVSEYDLRSLSRILTQRAKSRLIASNITLKSVEDHIPVTVQNLIAEVVEEVAVEEAPKPSEGEPESEATGNSDTSGSLASSEVIPVGVNPERAIPVQDTPTTDGKWSQVKIPYDDVNEIIVGLKVYTNKEVTCTVQGVLRAKSEG
ncbi:hypothetical protein BXZ70DRAFT_73634 [Cristinia sonorae]|uniref:Calpain catalytic domain-containing protein n=1 Tax=Cristinia sonorae TaxID=1940300 RepID=A0A8K0URB2_9AGAR|nr:hypothetical protein BXZ70DRAFT_73634 [Cristinia sonorae]